MPIPLLRLEVQVREMQVLHALRTARRVNPADFAQTLLDHLPQGDTPWTVWCDLTLLTDEELVLLAAWEPH